ncbi:MAG TPA: hypothetical protein VM260_00315 [Pirellula sp.]|nr:hypothetical protein [Pirellula sp.]
MMLIEYVFDIIQSNIGEQPLWEKEVAESILEVAKRADRFFMEASPIHETMRRLSKTFTELQVSFAIAGAMAANAHGHKRTTSDVDILISREDLLRFKKRWIGLGWVDKFEGSKNFRDSVTNVNVDALIVGEYPGDGLPKPVAFPHPDAVSECNDEGIPFISLKALIELKLASGMTAAHRLQDMADVMNLIRANNLELEYRKILNPYVAAKFEEMWNAAQVKEDY